MISSTTTISRQRSSTKIARRKSSRFSTGAFSLEERESLGLDLIGGNYAFTKGDGRPKEYGPVKSKLKKAKKASAEEFRKFIFGYPAMIALACILVATFFLLFFFGFGVSPYYYVKNNYVQGLTCDVMNYTLSSTFQESTLITWQVVLNNVTACGTTTLSGVHFWFPNQWDITSDALVKHFTSKYTGQSGVPCLLKTCSEHLLIDFVPRIPSSAYVALYIAVGLVGLAILIPMLLLVRKLYGRFQRYVDKKVIGMKLKQKREYLS